MINESYDYEDLIKELESDMAEGFFKNDIIYIVRDDRGMIIDYYTNFEDTINESLNVEEHNVYEILNEMKIQNRLIL